MARPLTFLLELSLQESKVGEDYVPYIPKSKPQDEERKKREEEEKRRKAKKVSSKDAFTAEFDDILAELSEGDIAELAGVCMCVYLCMYMCGML